MTDTLPAGQQVVSNPPGLPAIADRVADFAQFRRALLAPLAGEQSLANWHPVAGDLGLQVLEWWAYLGDVLTFYNERIANESYVRTAQDPQRLSDLVALIGYTPTPGIGATGTVALLRTAAHPNEPLSIGAGMALQSTATPSVPAQTFEVAGDWAFPGPSDIAVGLPPDDTLALNVGGGPASVLLAGRLTNVSPGDQLLLVAQGFDGSSDADWAWVQVTGVAAATDPGTGAENTEVTFAEAARFGPPPALDWRALIDETERLTTTRMVSASRSLSQLVAGTDRATAAARFGSEAAVVRPAGEDRIASDAVHPIGVERSPVFWSPGAIITPPAAARQAPAFRLLRPTQTASLFNQPNPPDAVVSTSGATPTLHLAAVVRSIAGGELMLVDGGSAGIGIGSVSAVSEILWTVPYPAGAPTATPTTTPTPTPPPAIVVAHTALGLTTPDAGVLAGLVDPTAVTLRFGFKPVGTIIGMPVASLAQLPVTVAVPPGWSPAGSSQSAVLQDATGYGVEVAIAAAGDGSAVISPAGVTSTQLDTALAVPLRLLLDLVPVTRGTTVVAETLGSGSNAVAGQSFTLRRAPLTYLQSGSAIVSTLTVYVDGIAWTEVPSLYAQDPDATVYAVTLAPDGTATITFGDGVDGARLPTGAGNVTARYRYGSGYVTPPAGRLTTVTTPQPNLASVVNPIAVGGGADPQSAADIRADAPASVQTFGRAISGTDYGIVAAQASGVARVGVIWSFDGLAARTTVTVYVGDDDGAVRAASAALAGGEDPNRPITVLAAAAVPLTLVGTLVIAPGRVLADVRAAAIAALIDPVAGPLAAAVLPIGAPLYRSELDAALLVDGVQAVIGLSGSSPAGVLDSVLSPGTGGYFVLPDTSGIAAVPGD